MLRSLTSLQRNARSTSTGDGSGGIDAASIAGVASTPVAPSSARSLASTSSPFPDDTRALAQAASAAAMAVTAVRRMWYIYCLP